MKFRFLNLTLVLVASFVCEFNAMNVNAVAGRMKMKKRPGNRASESFDPRMMDQDLDTDEPTFAPIMNADTKQPTLHTPGSSASYEFTTPGLPTINAQTPPPEKPTASPSDPPAVWFEFPDSAATDIPTDKSTDNTVGTGSPTETGAPSGEHVSCTPTIVPTSSRLMPTFVPGATKEPGSPTSSEFDTTPGAPPSVLPIPASTTLPTSKIDPTDVIISPPSLQSTSGTAAPTKLPSLAALDLTPATAVPTASSTPSISTPTTAVPTASPTPSISTPTTAVPTASPTPSISTPNAPATGSTPIPSGPTTIKPFTAPTFTPTAWPTFKSELVINAATGGPSTNDGDSAPTGISIASDANETEACASENGAFIAPFQSEEVVNSTSPLVRDILLFYYQLETAPRTVIEDVLPSLEIAFVDAILPAVFPSDCGTPISRNRFLQENTIVGVTATPNDEVDPNAECEPIVSEKNGCVVVNGRLSLFSMDGNVASVLDDIAESLEESMDNGKFVNPDIGVVRTSYLANGIQDDGATSVEDTDSSVMEPQEPEVVRPTGDRGSMLGVGLSLSAAGIFLFLVGASVYKRKNTYAAASDSTAYEGGATMMANRFDVAHDDVSMGVERIRDVEIMPLSPSTRMTHSEHRYTSDATSLTFD